jgi:hypothetical protein
VEKGEKNRGQAKRLPLAYGWFLRGESGTLGELVAYPSLSEDHFGAVGIIAELLPQAVDVLLQKAEIGDIFWAPYLLKQGAMGEHPTLVSNQLKEQLVLMGGQLHWLAGEEHIVCRSTDH